ncbi:3-dehydroquinate synthase [Sphingomicrobium arenosum]|uniref:3-dehydroquinate synthase n=1 Tax=Sphingomicrobium arenosum TaxID=2233861 RepID=UPI002240573F|nr:3-dehydroquinate synthase [Sphingomicrobium arenosum]
MRKILAPGREGATYPVLIGPLAETLANACPRSGKSLPCITDERIWNLHRDNVSQALDLDPFFVPSGEAAKSWEHLQRAIAFLASRNHQRSDPVIALGGGAVGDLAGLAAALYRRGVPVIQIPTTLLAQVDSSVGGKTAIDAEGEKNIVGAFHPPSAALIDPAFLATLDPREMRAGLAETVKYGLIGDPAFHQWLVDGGAERMLANDPEALRHAIATAVQHKADLVAGDLEDRSGRRALLNLGHTFGHAIESLAGLGTILHGEAVAIGMMLAAGFSAHQGLLPVATADRIASDLARMQLPTTLADAGLQGRGADLLEPMRHDKKNENGRLALILFEDIGKAVFVRDVAERDLGAFLTRF